MTGTYELNDGTVVRTETKDEKLTKKFMKHQLPVLILLTLFPSLGEHFSETMYSCIVPSEFSHFVRVCLAVLMVEERYGSLPEFAFDDLYGCINTHTFHIYERYGQVVSMIDSAGATLHQLTVSDAALDKVLDLILSAKPVDDMVPEPIIAVEDVSPELFDGDTSDRVLSWDVPTDCANDCLTCSMMRHPHEVDVRGSKAGRLYDDCTHIVETRKFKPPRIYTHILSTNASKVLYFGKKAFDKRTDTRQSLPTAIPGNRLWFLFRMPWEYYQMVH